MLAKNQELGMKTFVRWMMAATALWMVAGIASAQALVVDAPQVEKAIAAGALLWDARDEEDYLAGHLPGAVNIGNVGDVFRDANREDPPSAAAAARLFGGAGMDILGREVIVYTRKGDPYAYYGARMVEYYGGRHAKVFHGGLDDWKAAGKPLDKAPVKLAPVTLALSEGRGALDNRQLVERVRTGGAQILDTRTPKEFSGEDIRAIRGGHVPGALNVPYEQNWVDPAAGAKLAAKQVSNRDGMSLKPREELRKLYAKLDPAKETVVYCQSGVRASETAAVLRDLGFTDVKVHEPSWLGYAGVLSAPAEDEVFVNVGSLNGRVAALQGKVKDLEAEIAKLREAKR
jgi:thiosulfate/3-mercaptopyruvate sulfurtransferase